MIVGVLVEVVQHLRPGGIEKLAIDLIMDPPAGDSAVIVSLEGNYENALTNWPGLHEFGDRIIFLGKEDGIKFSLPVRLARLFRAIDARYVHTHHIGPLIYGGTACRLAGIKRLIHTEHDAWHLDDTRQARLTRWALRLLRPHLVADAAVVAQGIHDATGICADTVILNGVDTAKFSPGDRTASRKRFNLPTDRTVIGMAGRLHAVKNQSLAISAFASFDHDAILAIAGAGERESELKRTAVQLGVAERVRFLGHVDDMPSFYNAIDLFCLPSLNEGLPLCLLEAQSCGTRVVASDVGGAREAICPKTGYIVPPNDARELLTSWRTALSCATTVSPRDFVMSVGSREVMCRAYAEILQC